MVIFNEVFEYKTFSSQKKIRQRKRGVQGRINEECFKIWYGSKLKIKIIKKRY